MIETAEQYYLESEKISASRILGLGVTRTGYGRPTKLLPVVETGHPIPDHAAVQATLHTLALADAAQATDTVVVLLSGGASSNWIAPAPGLELSEKQAAIRALLRSGALVDEVNTVRKHLSSIKGGRLVARAKPAHVLTLAISDIFGNESLVLGSGPTVPDSSTLADARDIITRYRVELPLPISRALNDPANETPKPGDPTFSNTEFRMVARPIHAFRAVEAVARAAGYEYEFLGDQITGEAREIAAHHAALAREFAVAGRRAVIVSGGELTVSIRGSGRGGPNQEYVLALLSQLEGTTNIAALAADTSGTDGGEGSLGDPAGAYLDDTSDSRARALGLDPAAFLANNDSTGFFTRIGDLLNTGPTFTNVNDFRAIVVNPP
jgi:glycerate 2-kinase